MGEQGGVSGALDWWTDYLEEMRPFLRKDHKHKELCFLPDPQKLTDWVLAVVRATALEFGGFYYNVLSDRMQNGVCRFAP